MRALVIGALLLCGTLALWAQQPGTAPVPQEPAAGQAAAGDKPEPVEPVGVLPAGKTRFEGTIAKTHGVGPLTGFFSLQVDEWTSPEEAKKLLDLLATSGQDEVLKKIWKSKQVGYVKVGSSMGKPIFFARAIAVPGGVVVRTLTNVPISGKEQGTRAEEYPFGVVELVLPNEGEGYGTLVGMARLSVGTNGAVDIQAYGSIPSKIVDVKIDAPKKK